MGVEPAAALERAWVRAGAWGQTIDWFTLLSGPCAYVSGASGVPFTGCRILRGHERKRRLRVT